MDYEVLDYLYRELKRHKISLAQAETRNDINAIPNIMHKINCVEFMIDLVLKNYKGRENEVRKD